MKKIIGSVLVLTAITSALCNQAMAGQAWVVTGKNSLGVNAFACSETSANDAFKQIKIALTANGETIIKVRSRKIYKSCDQLQ